MKSLIVIVIFNINLISSQQNNNNDFCVPKDNFYRRLSGGENFFAFVFWTNNKSKEAVRSTYFLVRKLIFEE